MRTCKLSCKINKLVVCYCQFNGGRGGGCLFWLSSGSRAKKLNNPLLHIVNLSSISTKFVQMYNWANQNVCATSRDKNNEAHSILVRSIFMRPIFYTSKNVLASAFPLFFDRPHSKLGDIGNSASDSVIYSTFALLHTHT